ncbi:2-hydroxycarboxylate transporter family protein [Priestia megaterium]
MENKLKTIQDNSYEHPSQTPLWVKILRFKVTVIPLYVYIPMLILVLILIMQGKYPTDLLGIIPLMTLAGYTLGEIGKRTPVLKLIGGALTVIIATILFRWLN